MPGGRPSRNSSGVPLLIAGYDFDVGGDGVIDDPGTKYALDVTDYVNDRIANNDDEITVILVSTNPNFINQDGSEFKSKEIPDEEECDRPFPYVE